MRRRHRAAIIALLALCGACSSPRAPDPQGFTGKSRAAVIDELGEPASRVAMTKQTEHIFGPPEDWWHELEMGDSLETWTWVYPGEGSFSVYFLRGSETVDHASFTGEGVVY